MAREIYAGIQPGSAINSVRRVEKVRGDRLIELHDAQRRREDADTARAGLADQIAAAAGGNVIQFCRRVRPDVPSAKPSRMSFPEGMKDSHARTELRGMHIAGWGLDRQCAVARSLEYEVDFVLRKVTPDPVTT